MRGLVVEHQEKGFVGRAGAEPFEAEPGCDLGAVPFNGEAVAVDQEDRVAIDALAGQDDPTVEAGRVGAEVPLADHAGVVAGGLQALGDMVARTVEAIENRHAVEVRILAGEQRGTAGRADGVGDAGVLETCAGLGQPVDVRGPVDGRAVRGHRMMRVVV